MALFDFIKDIAGLAGAATATASLFGLGRGGGERRASQLAARQADIAEALANPQSPLFQQARQQAMEQSRTAQLQSIRDFMTAQARQARRFGPGGSGTMMVSNPRRDEMIARQLAMMGQNEAARADTAARQQLSGSMQGLGSAAQLAGLTGALRQQQALNRMAGLAQGLYTLGGIAERLPGTVAAGQRVMGFDSPVQQSVNAPVFSVPAEGAQRYTGQHRFTQFGR